MIRYVKFFFINFAHPTVYIFLKYLYKFRIIISSTRPSSPSIRLRSAHLRLRALEARAGAAQSRRRNQGLRRLRTRSLTDEAVLLTPATPDLMLARVPSLAPLTLLVAASPKFVNAFPVLFHPHTIT